MQLILCRMHYKLWIYDQVLLQESLGNKQFEVQNSLKSLCCHLMAYLEKASTALALRNATAASSGIHSTFLMHGRPQCPSGAELGTPCNCCKVINHFVNVFINTFGSWGAQLKPGSLNDQVSVQIKKTKVARTQDNVVFTITFFPFPGSEMNDLNKHRKKLPSYRHVYRNKKSRHSNY